MDQSRSAAESRRWAVPNWIYEQRELAARVQGERRHLFTLLSHTQPPHHMKATIHAV